MANFPIVEVDSSYYALPSAQNSALWVARTPQDFVFDVKAFRLFTGHQTAPVALPRDIADALGPPPGGKKNFYYADVPGEIRDVLWERYRDAIEPLREGGKLGAVLFQFAPWVAYHPRNRDHIDECRKRLAGFLLAVEFRNKTWFEDDHRDRTLGFERERGLVNVVVDEPNATANSIPQVWEVTVPELAIVRLHGRNQATWNIKADAASSRFDYDYTDAELEDLGRKISDLPVERAQVIFNNNYQDQGQRNARTLQGVVEALASGRRAR